MNKIIYIGMDVHSSNFTLCSFEPGYGMSEDKIFGQVQFKDDLIKNTEKYICNLKSQRKDIDIVCGYEAGCLGYVPYRELTRSGINCKILAPSTMAVQKGGKKLKNDFRDALDIARCLASGSYKAVNVPDVEDEDVRDYRLNAFCLRHGFQYDKSKWTLAHIRWIKHLECTLKQKEIINEYLATYEVLKSKLDAFDVRIDDFATSERYAEKVNKLVCIKGIKTNTAMSFISEVGDFKRFRSAEQFAGYIGLVPGEQSSGDKVCRTGITKSGNTHLRRLAVECCNSFRRGLVGQKSVELKKRQQNAPSEVINYADKASARCQRKYYRMVNKGKNPNIAVTAVAREFCCFIWGMMTSNYEYSNNEVRELMPANGLIRVNL